MAEGGFHPCSMEERWPAPFDPEHTLRRAGGECVMHTFHGGRFAPPVERDSLSAHSIAESRLMFGKKIGTGYLCGNKRAPEGLDDAAHDVAVVLNRLYTPLAIRRVSEAGKEIAA